MKPTAPITRDNIARLDAADPLAARRELFALPAGVIYLDGNSLGALPKSVAPRLARAVEHEWGVGLIRSWNDADWYPAPQRVGNRIAKLIGAADLDLAAPAEGDCQVLNLKSAREAADRKVIRHALARSEGNISSTAKLLGISRPTLYDLLKQYDLQA